MQVTPFLPGLSPVQSKSLTAALEAGNLSSNGGAPLLREAALRLDLADIIASALPETRNPLLVRHSYADMVTARMIAIECGYEDADDLDALRHDPALKTACRRAPESGASLPSQPTISQLENLAEVKTLYRIGINGFAATRVCGASATAVSDRHGRATWNVSMHAPSGRLSTIRLLPEMARKIRRSSVRWLRCSGHAP